MASVTQIKGKWRALVRLKGQKPVSRYFSSEAEAQAWGTQAEKTLRQAAKSVAGAALTVSAAVDAYRELRRAAGRPVAETSNQHYMLNHLAADLGDELVANLTPQRFVQWARVRRDEGAGPYTVYMELQALGSLLRGVAAYRNTVLPDVVGQARPLLHTMQLIGGGNRRSRRVLPGELEAIYEALPQYRDLLTVAVTVGLRRGEICRIVWTDLDEVNKAILVRKRKNPRTVKAKDQWVPLIGGTWDIVKRQPRTDARIFPVHPQTLTKAITDTTRRLGIPDLHLHDFRHEANSRLREQGFDEIERMAILGHTRPEQNAAYAHVTIPSLHQKADDARDKPPRRARRRKDPARQP